MRNLERLDGTLASPLKRICLIRGKKPLQILMLFHLVSEELGYAGAVLGGGN